MSLCKTIFFRIFWFKTAKNHSYQALELCGAEGEIRTPTSIRSPVPETGASTNSATSAISTMYQMIVP